MAVSQVEDCGVLADVMNDSSQAFDIIVLGAGAAGLFSALTAAQRGRRVLVLEKSNKVGKKILMSGGGRCNFTNRIVEADNFISNNPHFCKSALKRYTQWDFIELVERHGIEYEERKHGQLFCVHSSKDILNMLLEECRSVDVEIRTHCESTLIEPANEAGAAYRFRVGVAEGESQNLYDCESLVVATGALSIPTMGGSGMGYVIAEQFGLGVTERRAGLVPFMLSGAMKQMSERLSGIALEVEVACNGQSFVENLLFTHRGMSGPVVLQISNYWAPGDEIAINLLPGLDAREWLAEAKVRDAKVRLRAFLGRTFAKSLVSEMQALWWPNLGETALAELSKKQIAQIGTQLNRWALKPSATEGYRTAEVTLGGVDTAGVHSKTMEAKQHEGLYFVGEVLDVSGHLGGFNFQWAWSSGYTAGLYA